MRIKSQRLSQFKNHASSTIDYGDMTVLVGPAGSGKTSVLDALCLGLGGKNRLTDGRGAGAREQIRRGFNESKIELSIENGRPDPLSVTRVQTDNRQSLLVPWGTDLKGKQALLLEKLGITNDALSVLLDPTLIADRDPEQIKEILLKVVRPTKIDVPKPAAEYGITEISSVPNLNEHLANIKDTAIRDLNRDIRELVAAAPEDPGEDEWTAFNALTQEKAQLAGRKEGLTKKLSDLKEKLRTLEAAKEAEARNNELRAQIVKDLEGMDARKAYFHEQLTVIGDGVRKLQASAQETGNGLAEMRTKLKMLEDQHTAATSMSHTKRCGVLNVFVCPLPDPEKVEMAMNLRKQMEALKEEVRKNEEFLAKDHKDIENQSKAGRAKREEYDQVKEKISNLKGRLEAVPDQCNVAAVPDELRAESQSTEASLGQASQRQLEVEAELAKRNTQERAREARNHREALTAKRKRLEVAIAAKESLEALKSSIIASGQAADFETSINNIWQRFYPQVDIGVSTDGLFVRVAKQDGQNAASTLPVSHLSHGQKVMLDCAFRIAAAYITGAKILAMDDGNLLPLTEIGRLHQTLQESGCQVILLLSSNSTPPESTESVVYYRLRSETLTGPVHCERVI
jgi:DNA repair exonuclease SbcCD ATPase subunit